MDWITGEYDSWPRFSPWTRWEERGRLDLSGPGVYLVAKFEDRVSKVVLPPVEDVVYVGLAADQTLSERLTRFSQAVRTGKGNHAGGKTFHREFRLSAIPSWLLLAIHVVERPEAQRGPYIRYLERSLIWMYVLRHGKLPTCNKQ